MFENVKTIRIFTAPFNCTFCDRAKALCERFGLEYLEIVGNLPDGKSTYPQIYFDDEYVGGCRELFARARTEKFKD